MHIKRKVLSFSEADENVFPFALSVNFILQNFSCSKTSHGDLSILVYLTWKWEQDNMEMMLHQPKLKAKLQKQQCPHLFNWECAFVECRSVRKSSVSCSSTLWIPIICIQIAFILSIFMLISVPFFPLDWMTLLLLYYTGVDGLYYIVLRFPVKCLVIHVESFTLQPIGFLCPTFWFI